MKTRTTIIAGLAVVLLLAGTAIAQPGGMSGGSMGDRSMSQHRPGGGDNFFQRIMPMMRMLDLTDDQREAIGDIMEEARESLESIRGTDETGSHREEFLELFSSSSLSVSEVETLLNERIEAMEEANVIIAEALVGIHDELTPEQLAALAEFNPGSMEMRMGNGGMGGRSSGGNNMGVHPHR